MGHRQGEEIPRMTISPDGTVKIGSYYAYSPYPVGVQPLSTRRTAPLIGLAAARKLTKSNRKW